METFKHSEILESNGGFDMSIKMKLLGQLDTGNLATATVIANSALSTVNANDIVDSLECNSRCGMCRGCDTAKLIKQNVEFIEV